MEQLREGELRGDGEGPGLADLVPRVIRRCGGSRQTALVRMQFPSDVMLLRDILVTSPKTIRIAAAGATLGGRGLDLVRLEILLAAQQSQNNQRLLAQLSNERIRQENELGLMELTLLKTSFDVFAVSMTVGCTATSYTTESFSVAPTSPTTRQNGFVSLSNAFELFGTA